MKKTVSTLLMGLLAASLLAACQEATPEPDRAAAPDLQAAPEGTQRRAGTVLETMNAGGYTYVKVDTGAEAFWAAAPVFSVRVGDPVVVPEGMPMRNYHSKTLDRDFDVVYFVDAVQVGGDAQAAAAPPRLPRGHPDPAASGTRDAGSITFDDIEKVTGGQRVGEVFADRGRLAGQVVSVRGKVVKFNAGILGKNWLHVRDGTGEPGRNDLTVTTAATARVGDTVVVRGVLATDLDFGFGYAYEVIVEDADVTVER